MDRSYIYTSISTSLQVAELSLLGQLIFERMFPHADFQGRLPGHPRKVKATVIPMIDGSAEKVAEQIQKMHDLRLIVWYEASGEKYIQLVSWWKFQPLRFAHPSKFPAPEGWKDRLRYNDPRNPKHLIEENWTAHTPAGRPKKGDEEPIQDPYIGGLYREPIQGSYEGSEIHPYQESEIHPSASASAFTKERSNTDPAADAAGPLLPLTEVKQPGNGDGRLATKKASRTRKKAFEYSQAVRDVYQAYAENIVTIPAKKADALRNIAARLREGYTPEQLIKAVERYYIEAQDLPEDRRFHPNNFFGQKAYFLGYLPDAGAGSTEAVHV